jgi:hypothetical protein
MRLGCVTDALKSRVVHTPPLTVDQLEAVRRLLPTRYRLPLVVLDATGMRLGDLERSPGATSTSRGNAGASQRPSRRQGGRDG